MAPNLLGTMTRENSHAEKFRIHTIRSNDRFGNNSRSGWHRGASNDRLAQ